jgi:hypothetical protein
MLWWIGSKEPKFQGTKNLKLQNIQAEHMIRSAASIYPTKTDSERRHVGHIQNIKNQHL